MTLDARFRSPEGMRAFLAAYDAMLALWDVPYDTHDVSTRFGTTHINAAGSPDAPPVVLIHGGQVNSPSWYANIGALAQHFRVYAPDVVDQIGRSVPTRRLKTRADCADWLADVLDALHVERAVIGGLSHGGWQALNFAIAHPRRVERLVLLSPAGSFNRLSMALFGRMLPVLVMPTRAMFYWSFQSLTMTPLSDPHPLVEVFRIGALAFKPKELSLGVVQRFSDAELRGVQVPTLLLIGDHDITYPSVPQALERARGLMPSLQAELIANGGHLFPIEHADVVNARMLAFLRG